jgi:hypothetical protein
MTRLIGFASCLLCAMLALSAQAVSTSNWTQANQEDFKKGDLENVVATNLGDVKLSRAVKMLMEQDPKISVVNAMAEAPDGTIYAGTGPQGVLLAIKDQKVSTVATIEGEPSLTSLIVEKSGRVLIGASGEHGQVLAIDKPGDKPHVIFEADGIQYIWAMVQTPDGMTYVATGPTGKLYELKPDGSNKVLLDSGQNNLLSLVGDGKDLLYVGSDPHGLIYRVNRTTGESFVLYNAAEAEVDALALDKAGNLYAATSEAEDSASNAPASTPSADTQGRPEGGQTGVPIPAEVPKQPKPPQLPDPNPGEPAPIPKHKSSSGTDDVRFFPLSPRERAGVRGSWNTLSRAARAQFPLTLTLSRRERGPADALSQGVKRPIVLLAADVVITGAAPAEPRKKPVHPQPPPGPKPGPNPDPGKPQPPPAPIMPGDNSAKIPPPTKQPTVNTANSGEPRPEGNAVYKIDRDGFVTEIFREPVLVLSIVEHEGILLIATGSEGEIYQVNPAADETIVLAKADAKQITCLLPASDGNIYMGMANVGSIATMSSGYAATGTYTSQVLDATQISRFGKLHLHGSLPHGTSLTVATRSGNLKEPDEKGWSSWTADVPAEAYLPVTSPSARFLQYRLTFTSENRTASPVIDEVNVAYQIPNLAPQVKSIKVTASNSLDSLAASSGSGGTGSDSSDLRRVTPSPKQTINWDASDPNNDALIYSLYFRKLAHGPWILLKDDLTDTTFDWDTRTVADGRYQLKVVASDANANPPGQGKTANRVSDPIIVDNTPPVIGDLKWSQKGAAAQLDFKIVDAGTTVAACDFSVDSNKDWQMVLPVDKIFDSPEEIVSFSTSDLRPGQHQITLRATDAKGNQAFQTVFVTIKEPVAEK